MYSRSAHWEEFKADEVKDKAPAAEAVSEEEKAPEMTEKTAPAEEKIEKPADPFSPENFMIKVSWIQTYLKAPKDKYNSFGGYSYRSAEGILNALKPLLYKARLVLTVTDDIMAVGDQVYVKATARLTDGVNTIENTAFAREPKTKKGMDDSQITGSTSSYARKYALNGLFCIDDTADPDTNEYHKMTN